jgi:hypothetical protein
MSAVFRIDAGLKIGLAALAFGAWMAACGTITEVNSDGSTMGTGGTPGGGTGGGHGGTTGGVGGRPGSGGLGGTNGSGVGGKTGGGTGGVVGGGAGGVVGGAGGVVGGGVGGLSGGGLGGTPGSGVGGTSGGVTCADIQKAFLVAMVEAKTCVVGATGNCLKATLDRLDCGCTTFVNQTDRLDSIRQSWVQNGCSTGVCTAILCVGYKSGVCTVPASGGTASCQDSIALPTP